MFPRYSLDTRHRKSEPPVVKVLDRVFGELCQVEDIPTGLLIVEALNAQDQLRNRKLVADAAKP